MDEIARKNPLALAFLGDAAIKLWVSHIFVGTFDMSINDLHKMTSSIVCAKNQSEVYEEMYHTFSDIEQNIATRAFNAKHKTVPKNCTMKEYRQATAYEAVVGYRSLSEDKKVYSLVNPLIENGIKR